MLRQKDNNHPGCSRWKTIWPFVVVQLIIFVGFCFFFFWWGLPQKSKTMAPCLLGSPNGPGILWSAVFFSGWRPCGDGLRRWHRSSPGMTGPFTVLHQLSLLTIMDGPDVAKWMLLMMGWDSWSNPLRGWPGGHCFWWSLFALQDVKFPLFALGVGTIEQWSTYGPSRVPNDCPGFLGWVKVCVSI